MNYLKKHYEHILAGSILIICFLLYCINIASYSFIDTDETKFVSIAKEMLNYSDWINIKLNGENVFNLSPLYFWLTNLSCLIFGEISGFTMRISVSLTAVCGIIFLFYTLKGMLTKTYAYITTLLTATCLGSIIFSRLATNDLLFSVLTMCSILCVYMAIFKKNEKNTAKLWIMTYVFGALASLTGGLFGFLIPAVSIVLMYIFSGNLKEIFKAKNLIPGAVLFMMIIMPWYIIMLSKYGIVFIKERIFMYNFFNYISIKEIAKVTGIFLALFLPWSFSFLWVFANKFKSIISTVISYFKDNSQAKLKEKWQNLKITDKFLSLNTIVFFTGYIFSLLYGAKYTFLILFLIFPASCISGFYWYEYIIRKKHDKSIFFATMIPNLILIVCSLLGLFGHNIINTFIFKGLSHIVFPLVIIFFVTPLIGIFSIILKGRIPTFVSNLLLMICLSFVLTPTVFNVITLNSGENDLINYATIAKKDKVKLTAYLPSKKYSLIYYYDSPVEFHLNNDVKWLKTYLINHPMDYVVAEIKDLSQIKEANIKYMLLDAGKRYCLIQHMMYDIEKLQDNSEPEIIVY